MFERTIDLPHGGSVLMPFSETGFAGMHDNVLARSLVDAAGTNNRRRVRSIGIAPSQTGFTIIELLVAIAVAAALVAVAVPSYESHRNKALVAQAASDIKSLDVLIAQYYADNMRLPDSLADVGKGGMLDPWKNPYRYLKLSPLSPSAAGKMRKDKNLVPINSDFDLYSMGKDSVSQAPLTAASSRDDIVRGSNGRYIGLAAEY